MEMPDQLGFQFRAPERHIWSVRALVAAVRGLVERQYSDCWVEGEISNLRIRIRASVFHAEGRSGADSV